MEVNFVHAGLSETHGTVFSSAEASRAVCIAKIPSYLIPREFIEFLNSFSDKIISVTILQYRHDMSASGDLNTYSAILILKSEDFAQNFLHEFNGYPFSSLDSAICTVFFVDRMVVPDGSENVQSVSDTMNIAFSIRKPAIRLLHQCLNVDKSDLNDVCESPVCAVCLDSISLDGPFSITMYCGHCFHAACVAQLESTQCPVCRFEHDESNASLSCCSVCAWQGAETALSRPTTLEGATRLEQTTDRDVWVCLVCGFVGCGSTNAHHIRSHFEDLGHSYAMNTDTNAVFDFAGQGYVHRLAVMDYDAMDSAASVKVTEVPDPRSNSDMRPSQAPVSRELEEHTIAVKLENIARQYSQLLAAELSRQRRQHEEQLLQIRGFMKEESAALWAPTPRPEASSALPRGVSPSVSHVQAWRTRIHAQLQADRSRAMRQAEQVQERVARACSELGDALELQRGLAENERDLRMAAAREQLAFEETEAGNTKWIHNLEEKVAKLMAELNG